MKTKSSLFIREAFTFTLFILSLFPFALVVINSGKDIFSITSNPLALPHDFLQVFRNMARIWSDPNLQYGPAFRDSLIITLSSLIVLVLVSAQAGWILVRTKTRSSQLVFFLFIASMVVPFQIIMLPLVSWFRMIGDLTGIGLLRHYSGIILSHASFGMPLAIFMYHGFIKGIPYELEEAAKIDGCSHWRTFYMIIFPLLKPITATVMVLNGFWVWNDYLLPLIILGKGHAIQTIPIAVSKFAGAYVKQWDLILSSTLLAMIPIIIFFLFMQRYIIKGMVSGAIK